jgi:glutamate-1-semialdehyde 2,1-aminomutase
VVSYSHTDEDIELTVDAIDGALEVYRRALDDGVEGYLVGRPSQTVYRRYNRPDDAPRAVTPRVGGDGPSEMAPGPRGRVSV